MVTGFTKQKESVELYKKYGFEYPAEIMPDALHEKFMEQTSKSPQMLNFKYITRIVRRKTGDGREWIVYDLMWRRTDSLGNQKRSYQPNMGIIPRVEPITRVKRDEEGWESKYVARLDIIGKTYLIPFTKENLDKLVKDLGEDCLLLNTEEGRKKMAQDQAKRERWAAEHDKNVYRLPENMSTQLIIHKDGEHWKIPIKDYEDFVNGDFEELYRYGKIRTPLEKKYDDLRRFGRELSNEEREIEMSIPFIVAPGNKLDTMTETAEMEFRKARGEGAYQ